MKILYNISIMKNRQLEILKAMSHPVRLQILEQLLEGSLCAGEANESIAVSQPNLSQHLKKLREAGMIDMISSGTKRCYYITMPKCVETILRITQDPEREIKSMEEVMADLPAK